MFQNASKWSQSHSPCCDRINERHAYVLQQASDALGGPHTLRSLTALHNQNWQVAVHSQVQRAGVSCLEPGAQEMARLSKIFQTFLILRES